METETMGRVTTEATIESMEDLWAARRGLLPAEQVRRITVSDALADSGATLLSLPTQMIRQLGLTEYKKKRVRTAAGEVISGVYDAVRLTIQGRDCTVDVMEIPDGSPVLIGQIPLEALDFVLDMRAGSLIGNPAHGGEWILECY